eukprot:SAG25_NODE_465_length_7765_cov_162.049048_6_plen_561_part_00
MKLRLGGHTHSPAASHGSSQPASRRRGQPASSSSSSIASTRRPVTTSQPDPQLLPLMLGDLQLLERELVGSTGEGVVGSGELDEGFLAAYLDHEPLDFTDAAAVAADDDTAPGGIAGPAEPAEQPLPAAAATAAAAAAAATPTAATTAVRASTAAAAAASTAAPAAVPATSDGTAPPPEPSYPPPSPPPWETHVRELSPQQAQSLCGGEEIDAVERLVCAIRQKGDSVYTCDTFTPEYAKMVLGDKTLDDKMAVATCLYTKPKQEKLVQGKDYMSGSMGLSGRDVFRLHKGDGVVHYCFACEEWVGGSVSCKQDHIKGNHRQKVEDLVFKEGQETQQRRALKVWNKNFALHRQGGDGWHDPFDLHSDTTSNWHCGPESHGCEGVPLQARTKQRARREDIIPDASESSNWNHIKTTPNTIAIPSSKDAEPPAPSVQQHVRERARIMPYGEFAPPTNAPRTRHSGQVHSLGITPEDRSVQYLSCNDKLNHAPGYQLTTAGPQDDASVTGWVMEDCPEEAFRRYGETLPPPKRTMYTRSVGPKAYTPACGSVFDVEDVQASVC